MQSLWQRFRHEMRNPRKVALLGGLALVALVMWGRLALEQVPQLAGAASGEAEAIVVDDAAPWAEPVLPAEPARPKVALKLEERLPRDLFALPREHFKLSEDARTRQQAEKSAVEPADESSRFSEVRRAAEALTLESIVTGDRPRALISGRLLEPGQQVRGFTLVRVAQRFVVLEKDGVRVRLNL